MNTNSDFQKVFSELSTIMRNFSSSLDCARDDDEVYYLNTTHIMKNKKPLYFGSVHIKKNYVSYHLMPVYVFPDLLKGMSPALKKRMQGKSCFNFKSVDADLFKELGELTGAGRQAYKKAGYLQK